MVPAQHPSASRDSSPSLPHPVQILLLLRWLLIPSNFAEGKLIFPEEAQAGSKTSEIFNSAKFGWIRLSFYKYADQVP